MHTLDHHTYNFRFWVIQANSLDQDLQGQNCIYQLLYSSICIHYKLYLFCNGKPGYMALVFFV